jgi:hypothetical protein
MHTPLDTNFHDLLLSGRISEFDLTQDCNMGGSYTRCFYKLTGDDTIYKELYLPHLYIKWVRNPETKEIKTITKQEDSANWLFIYSIYDETRDDFQLRFVRKVA